MIRYTLRCSDEHSFESWFQSAEAFEKLNGSDMLNCPSCGSVDIEKAIMAPQIQTSHKMEAPDAADATNTMHALSAPSSPAEAAIVELKKKIQENSEYVGGDFATEARKIHDGDAPERSIYGEAKPEEAKKLVEDGVPVAPLPFIPIRKSN
ncbi:MAG: DUF1178 family protein [Paracoccaceae bacterium]